MPDVLVRDLSEDMSRRLTERALRHGRSEAQEASFLIQQALMAGEMATAAKAEQPGLGTQLASLIKPEDWSDDLIPPRDRDPGRPPPDFK